MASYRVDAATGPIDDDIVLRQPLKLLDEKQPIAWSRESWVNDITSQGNKTGVMANCGVEHARRRALWAVAQHIDEFVRRVRDSGQGLIQTQIGGVQKTKWPLRHSRLHADARWSARYLEVILSKPRFLLAV